MLPARVRPLRMGAADCPLRAKAHLMGPSSSGASRSRCLGDAGEAHATHPEGRPRLAPGRQSPLHLKTLPNHGSVCHRPGQAEEGPGLAAPQERDGSALINALIRSGLFFPAVQGRTWPPSDALPHAGGALPRVPSCQKVVPCRVTQSGLDPTLRSASRTSVSGTRPTTGGTALAGGIMRGLIGEGAAAPRHAPLEEHVRPAAPLAQYRRLAVSQRLCSGRPPTRSRRSASRLSPRLGVHARRWPTRYCRVVRPSPATAP